MRRLVCAMLLVAASFAPASPASAANRVELPDGFVVSKGTRLLGAVIPDIGTFRGVREVSGWSAYFWVDTDARTAFNAYARQAARRGLLVRHGPGSFQANCAKVEAPYLVQPSPRESAADSLWCGGVYEGNGLSMMLVVSVCDRCVHPTAAGRLSVSSQPVSVGGSDIELVPTTAPTAALTSRQRQRARDATPDIGDRFTNRLANGVFPPVVPGTRALSAALYLGNCNEDLVALLRVTGNKDRVLGRLHGNEPDRIDFNGGHATTFRYSDSVGLTLVEPRGGGDPIIRVSYCDD